MVMSLEREYGSLVGGKAGPVKAHGRTVECFFECLLEH